MRPAASRRCVAAAVRVAAGRVAGNILTDAADGVSAGSGRPPATMKHRTLAVAESHRRAGRLHCVRHDVAVAL